MASFKLARVHFHWNIRLLLARPGWSRAGPYPLGPISTVNTGGLVCTRWKKQGVGVKCANEQMQRVDWAAAEHLLSPFSSPFFRVKWLYDYGFWVWMEAGRWVEFRTKMFPYNCTLQSSNSERSDLWFKVWKRICYKKNIWESILISRETLKTCFNWISLCMAYWSPSQNSDSATVLVLYGPEVACSPFYCIRTS